MAKLTEAAAVKLLGKLSRTGQFPEDREALTDLALTLMQAAPEVELARQVIEELRRECKFCPSDAEFFKTAERLRAAATEPAKPPSSWPPKWAPRNERCPVGQCDGSGWVIVTVAGVEGSKSCACRAKSTGSAA